MESLSDTNWDVLISGTGLQQSLLALALSRSGKKILHVDKHEFYGGPDAAFSLQEVEEWVKKVVNVPSPTSVFSNASIVPQPELASGEPQAGGSEKLGLSRAYSLSLSPQLIYSRSKLLQILVSSRVYRQLEFLAVGSWWLYHPTRVIPEAPTSSAADAEVAPEGDEGAHTVQRPGELRKVPNGREDIFKDSAIDLRSKRSLMKFLKFVVDYEQQLDVWEAESSRPFPEFLSSKFNMPANLQTPLLALTLTPNIPEKTTTGYALPRIFRHLKSIGVFGPGFGAVIAKWGGGAEVSQVACRAQAVGGGVYVLGGEVQAISHKEEQQEAKLATGDGIKTKWIVGSEYDLPASDATSESTGKLTSARSTSVVSSPLQSLFPEIAEGAPPPAGAVIVFPSGSLAEQGATSTDLHPPVYVIVHSSETGECPVGQCVLYASVSAVAESGYPLLDQAVDKLVHSVEDIPAPRILYRVKYTQASASEDSETSEPASSSSSHILSFQPPPLDLVFDDSVIDRVQAVWKKISGDGGDDVDEEFMTFEDREEAAAMSGED